MQFQVTGWLWSGVVRRLASLLRRSDFRVFFALVSCSVLSLAKPHPSFCLLLPVIYFQQH